MSEKFAPLKEKIWKNTKTMGWYFMPWVGRYFYIWQDISFYWQIWQTTLQSNSFLESCLSPTKQTRKHFIRKKSDALHDQMVFILHNNYLANFVLQNIEFNWEKYTLQFKLAAWRNILFAIKFEFMYPILVAQLVHCWAERNEPYFDKYKVGQMHFTICKPIIGNLEK